MNGINKAIIVGTLGNDPDMRTTSGGTTITRLNVATSERWKDKSSGDMQERTEWHRISLFGRTAEVAAEYLHKGSRVYVEGRIRTNKYADKDGVERYATEIAGHELQLLDPRPQLSEHLAAPRTAAQKSNTEAPFEDDDIPF